MKRLILLGMAVAALAVPAVASASPELEDATGKVVTGAEITAKSTNATITNTVFGLNSGCALWTFKAAVSSNTGTHVAAKGTAGATTTCFAEGKPLTVTKPTLLSLTTNGGDKGTLSVTFIMDVAAFECHFIGVGEFTYSTGSGNDTIHIPGITLAGPELCEPEEGFTYFEGDFTLTTESNGAPLFIS